MIWNSRRELPRLGLGFHQVGLARPPIRVDNQISIEQQTMTMTHYFSRALVGVILMSTIAGQASTLLFTAPREAPRRLEDGLSADASGERASFAGTARPGEFFVFQIGLEPDAATGPLVLRCSDLKSDRDSIPARRAALPFARRHRR